MRKSNQILIAALIVVAIAGCKKQESTPEPEPNEAAPAETSRQDGPTLPGKIGDTAWPLDGLEFVKGTPVKIEPGKVHVVEFWATWCGPCRVTIPHLTQIAKKYKDKNVVVVGISKEDKRVVEPFVTGQGPNMDYNVAVDPSGAVNKGYMTAFGQNGIPHAFLVDGQGKVAWHGHPMTDLEQVLQEVLAGTFDAIGYAQEKAAEEEQFIANMKTYRSYFEKIQVGGTLEEAGALVDEWIDTAPARMLNALAWDIMTELHESQRDKPLALRAAERANTLAEGKDPSILDTYALALFQNGRVAEAIAAQEKAVEMVAGDAQMEPEMRERLDQFKAALEPQTFGRRGGATTDE